MHSATILDHFQNPRNVGELPPPACTVDASNPACGDMMRLSIQVADDRIAQVRFKTRGCVASIACGSVLTEMLNGKQLSEAAQISPSQVSASLGGLPAESGHAAVLAVDALKAALKLAAQSASGA